MRNFHDMGGVTDYKHACTSVWIAPDLRVNGFNAAWNHGCYRTSMPAKTLALHAATNQLIHFVFGNFVQSDLILAF